MGHCSSHHRPSVPEGLFGHTNSERERAVINKAAFIRDYEFPGDFQQWYAVPPGGAVGAGAFASVHRAVHRTTAQVRAVKCIDKLHLPDVQAFKNEVDIMKQLDHPNIIRLFDTFQSFECVQLVMELCEGGSLQSRLAERPLTERDVAHAMRDTLRAVRYIHQKNIVHRDIKPENLLLLARGSIGENTVKLIDFGVATHCPLSRELDTKVGTPSFMAPEVLFGRYGRQCDLWSCGAAMYTCFAGSPPFCGRSQEELETRIRMAIVCFNRPEFQQVSSGAKDVIRQLMQKNPRSRSDPADVLCDSWMSSQLPGHSDHILGPHLADALRSFGSLPVLQQAALLAVAGHVTDSSSSPEVKAVKDAFFDLDSNDDGTITSDDLSKFFSRESPHVSRSELSQTIETIDMDNSGKVEYTEFVAAALGVERCTDEDVCRCAFQVFDLDGNGHITLMELHSVLQRVSTSCDSEVLQAMQESLQQADLDGNGTLEFQEFVEMVRASKRSCSSAKHSGNHKRVLAQNLVMAASGA